jgi:hypothetical protein
MRGYVRPETCLTVLAVGLLGAGLAWQGWSRAMNPARQQRGSRLLAEPPEGGHVASERIRAKSRVVSGLLEGEMTLVEAAAWFRFVNDNPPEYPCLFRETITGRSDGEKACRQVIYWVRARLRAEMTASQADLVLCRLQGDLDTLLAQDDAVELPW